MQILTFEQLWMYQIKEKFSFVKFMNSEILQQMIGDNGLLQCVQYQQNTVKAW